MAFIALSNPGSIRVEEPGICCADVSVEGVLSFLDLGLADLSLVEKCCFVRI